MALARFRALGADLTARRSRVANWLIRAGYRLAFQGLRAWWFVARPETNGAVCALWFDGKVLMVRNSYRPWLTFPGGFRKAQEAAADAVAREIEEEVGLKIDRSALRHVRWVSERRDFRVENTDLFDLTLDAAPRPKVDNREVTAAVMLTPAEALDECLYPLARVYLEEVRRKAINPS